MFFFRKTSGKTILMIEIQSSLVRASLVWFRPDKHPYILYDGSRYVPHGHKAGNDRLVAGVLEAITESLDEAKRYYSSIKNAGTFDHIPRHISETHFILSSPWMISRARTVSVAFEHPTKITRRYVEGLLAAERRKIDPDETHDHNVSIIEEKILEVRLNGYPISDWKDREAARLDLSYAVTAGGETIDRFRRACSRISWRDSIYFHSSLLLEYAGISAMKPGERSYFIVNVHGKMTDMASIKEGVCVFFGSFPIGVRTIIKDVSSAMKTDMGTAESAISLYIGEKFDEAHSGSIAEAVGKASSAWIREYAKMATEAGYSNGLPMKAMIYAKDHEDLFVEAIRRSYPTENPTVLSMDDVAEKVSFDPHAEQLRMVGLYATAIGSLTM
ncbi:MAG: hypothetical protein KGI49_00510 [Patescibacteria group bacterium]|nr:hypothetical protein [Patescibacteria group bacterium]